MARAISALSILPGIAAIKDLDSHYSNVSPEFSAMLGWNYHEDAIGKSDFQIPCDVHEFAEDFISMDKQVIQSDEKILTLDFQNYRSGWKLLIIEKLAVKNSEGEIAAIKIQGIDLTKTSLYRGYLILHQLDQSITGKKPKAISYKLDQSGSALDLTAKQEACLFFLVRGKTTKEIGRILKVSPRTVESHLDAIKNKLQCHGKSEIIEKVIEGGFFYHIPKRLLDVNL